MLISKIKHYLTLLIIFIVSTTVNANPNVILIRDAETEQVILEIAKPLFEAANLFNPKIVLIKNAVPNAFVGLGETVHIYTGLITKFPNPDVLRGVIAHEIGHIIKKHLMQQEMNIVDQSRVVLPTIMLGIAATATSGNPEVAIHSILLGGHIAESNILKFSRENESSADQVAVGLLEQTGHSARGLLTFLNYLNRHHKIPKEEAYNHTHPLNEERVSFINNHIAKSRFVDSKNTKKLESRYQLVAAKLIAFDNNEAQLSKLSSTAITYGKAIINMMRSNKGKALELINSLIKSNPHNPYYHELKGQILLHFSDPLALKEYGKAYELSNNQLLKLEYAIASITFNKDAQVIQNSINSLESILINESNNLTVLEFLSLAYDKIGLKGESLFYKAQAALKAKNFKLAKQLAIQAKNILKPSTTFWLKADDIIRIEQ